MNDNDQLIAVAEVLGWKKLDTPKRLNAGFQGWVNCFWQSPQQRGSSLAEKDLPNWLTSLDACFADIVPAMKKEGWLFDLENSFADPESWYCVFFDRNGGPITATAPTAPRAIVKAFLMFNGRWIE